MGKRKGAYGVCWENLKKEENLEDPGLDGGIILR
jgi:hypothetical protein